MGTGVRVVAWVPDVATADRVVADAFAEVARLDSLFSDWRPDSGIAELERAAGTGPRPVAPELAAVLAEATRWHAWSDGAFDVTVGPATRAWRRATRTGELPPPEVLDSLRSLVDGRELRVDVRAGTAELTRPGMSLDLGGIAKGWVADRILARLVDAGLPIALVDAGGDLALGDAPPGESGWRVEFPGGEVHRLHSVAVATSGDRYRVLEIDGVRYSHRIDPRTALGVIDAPTVVVVAPRASTADALASALGLMAPERARARIDSLGAVAVRIVPRAPSAAPWETADFPRIPAPRESSR